MTFGTEQKRHLLRRYRNKGVWQNSFPTGVNVYIYSGMRKVKQKKESVRTVQEFVEYAQAPMRNVLEDKTKNIKHFIYLLDQAATVGNMVCGSLAKSMFTAYKRDKGVAPLPFPPNGVPLIPEDGLLPHQWEAVIANRDLTRASVYHLFFKAIIERYNPPPGKCVIMDGAPNHQLSKEEYDRTKSEAFSRPYYVETTDPGAQPGGPQVTMSSREILATPVRQVPMTYRGACGDHYVHHCAEDDLSAIRYLNHYREPGANIVIDGGDGDLIFTALLHTKDRVDPETFKFINRVWVKLEGKKETRDAFQRKLAIYNQYKKDCEAAVAARKPEPKEPKEIKGFDPEDPINGEDVYININALYKAIEHPSDELSCAQYPQGMFTLLYILSGTDFFGEVSPDDPYKIFYGFGGTGWEPCVFNTWCKYKEHFSHMLMVFFSQGATFGQPDMIREVHLDEEMALRFFYHCYAAKYGDEIRKCNPGLDKITPSLLREFTSKFMLNVERKLPETDEEFALRVSRMRKGKNETPEQLEERKANAKRKEGETEENYKKRLKQAKKKRMPPDHILRRYARLWKLAWIYWAMDGRPGSQKVCDPLERYKNLPYYGFMIDPNSPPPKDPNSRPKVILSPVVSPPKPVPDFYAKHVTAKRARRENSSGDHEEVAKRIDEQAADKHAAEVRQAEREERRRQRDKKAVHLSRAAAVERTPEEEAVLKRALLKKKASTQAPKLVRGPPSTTVNVFL